jgi:hypothetical protein
MLIQIYEITTAEEAAALSNMGVDHIGVLVGEGEFPREQPLKKHAKSLPVSIRDQSAAPCLSRPTFARFRRL